MINLTYSPIAAALGVAAAGGAAQGKLQKSQQDLDFIKMMQDVQARYDQQNQNEISQALGVQATNAELDMKQQAAQQAAQQQQIENEQRNRQLSTAERAAAAQAASGQARNTLAQTKYENQQAAIEQLPEDVQPVVGATGRMPYVPRAAGGQDRSFQQLEAESRRLNAALQQKMKELNSYVYDDRRDLGYKDQGSRLPTGQYVIKGMERPYSDAKMAAQQLQAKLDEINGALTSRVNSLTGQEQPAVAPEVAKQLAAPAPAPQAGGGQPPVVHTMQEYVQVPSGSLYIDAQDGQTYRKK